MKIGKAFYDNIKKNEVYRQVYECVDCGGCSSIWPLEHRCSLSTGYKGAEACPRGLNWIMQAVQEDNLTFSDGLVDLLFRCTTCNQCIINCPKEIETRVYIEALRRDLVEEGAVPKNIMATFESASLNGNVWGKPRNRRSKWADGLNISLASEANEFDFLVFVGDSSSYVERNQETAKKFIAILNQADVSYAYLGNEERSSGNEVLRMGEQGLFQILAEENIAAFNKYGVEKIVALSPHSFHALKNEYPKLDPDFRVEVVHYTQFLHNLIKEGKLSLTRKIEKKVTYQDSCYLAKHNSIYEEPREILCAIPGLKLVEMDFVKEKGVCCGGGGGGVWMERGKGVKVEEIRLGHAMDAGAEIVATACPFCTQMLESVREEADNKDRIEVKDIIELVYEAL